MAAEAEIIGALFDQPSENVRGVVTRSALRTPLIKQSPLEDRN